MSFAPDLLFYLAGADPYREDQLGGLALTIDGLKRRDQLVFERRSPNPCQWPWCWPAATPATPTIP